MTKLGTTHERKTKTDLTGRTYGQLTVQRFISHKGWECLCACGRTRIINAAELNRGYATTCGNKRLHQRGPNPTYHEWHKWLRADLGPARHHPCTDCGNPAHHWSYDNNAGDHELTTPEGYLYVVDTSHYQPRCRPCHRQHDLAERARRGLPLTGRREATIKNKGRGLIIAESESGP